MPFIKMSCSEYFLLCFLICERVVLVDVRQNSYEEITLNLYGTNVSCFSTYFSSPSNNQITRHSIKALILWSLKDKSVQVWFKAGGKWHSVDIVGYQPNCCTAFTVGIDDCSFKLLPLVKEPDNTLIEVFAHGSHWFSFKPLNIWAPSFVRTQYPTPLNVIVMMSIFYRYDLLIPAEVIWIA